MRWRFLDGTVYSGTRISERTATSGRTDLAAMARAVGIEAVTVNALEAFEIEASGALADRSLHFVLCKVEESLVHREIPRPVEDLAEGKYRFVRYLERTQGRPIPFVGRG